MTRNEQTNNNALSSLATRPGNGKHQQRPSGIPSPCPTTRVPTGGVTCLSWQQQTLAGVPAPVLQLEHRQVVQSTCSSGSSKAPGWPSPQSITGAQAGGRSTYVGRISIPALQLVAKETQGQKLPPILTLSGRWSPVIPAGQRSSLHPSRQNCRD